MLILSGNMQMYVVFVMLMLTVSVCLRNKTFALPLNTVNICMVM